ncbi:MAG: MlaC/ttg2D family ABC transporter substrate-binding protein [Brevirhabdus sp.]
MTRITTLMRTPTRSEFNRRAMCLGMVSGLGATILPRSVFAMTESSTAKLVDQLVNDIYKVIESGKSESAMYRDFEKIFDRYADVPIIARSALGADARRASSSQISAFTKVFKTYISRKYGKRFREFIGGRIEVNSSKAVKSFYEVKTTAYLKGQAPFEVKFLVSDKSGKLRFFNMFIEGVNMMLTERTEIGAMLDKRKGNIDQLIADLKSFS